MSVLSASWASATAEAGSVTRNVEENESETAMNAACFEENQEFVENLSDEMSAKRAYINIPRNNLQDYSLNAFARTLVAENAGKRKVPIPNSITRAGTAFRLGFLSEKDRDNAVLHGVAIDSILVTVEPPRLPQAPTSFRQTIYIFGIPEEESDVRVAAFLIKSGLRPVSDF